MQVQSLSIVVPGGCPNKCRFCVSCLHPGSYENQVENNLRFQDLYERDFQRRMEFARDNGCNTVMLTGNGEPLINKNFLNNFAEWNKSLKNPFNWIEVQTSGVTLTDEKLRWLRNKIGVSVISLSLSSVFSSEVNAFYNRTPEKLKIDIDSLCLEIKKYDFALRLSLNLTDDYNNRTADEVLFRCNELGADQITFRVLYQDPDTKVTGGDVVNDWIRDHRCKQSRVTEYMETIQEHGRLLRKLPFGANLYSLDGMSIVVDDDCMSTQVHAGDSVKYLVLQPNCKLYSLWDDPGSLLF